VLGLPLLAAILFACAALLIKRSGNWRIDIWRVSFLCNVVTGLAFQPFLLFRDQAIQWSLWWQPLIVALLYVLGQVLTLTALARGEISVAAPVLGLKIIFVPLFLWLIAAGLLPTSTWLACLGATLGVVLLNASDGSTGRGRVGFSILTAGAGAAAFALFDVCVQLWSAPWGPETFLPVMFIMATTISLILIPFFQGSLRSIPTEAWPTLLGGATFFALQALAIVCSVAYWEQVAVSNVVYSSRGLWSLAFVWLLGKQLHASDTGLTPRVAVLRGCGAGLLLLSIVALVV
jgi:drug/metabolite transporter (DMT)-like permease